MTESYYISLGVLLAVCLTSFLLEHVFIMLWEECQDRYKERCEFFRLCFLYIWVLCLIVLCVRGFTVALCDLGLLSHPL